ncbi:MAG: tyrosine-type recombinase/integrase [Eubacterium sp.]|nr:tyrosine-type recombinase/integrase [Eubacterium sp.]
MTAYEKFNEIKTAYLSSLQTITKSKATYDKYATVINDFALWLGQNDTEQPDITAVMVINYSKAVKERGTKNNTLRHYLIILRSFFTWCINHKFYTEQPVLEEDIPKQERIEYNLLTEQQIQTILDGKMPPYLKQPLRDRALIVLLIESGLRVSELTHLKIKDIDFDGGTINVHTSAKGDKSRSTTLPDRSKQFITEYLYRRFGSYCYDENELLFANDDGKPYTRQNITKIVRGYIRGLFNRNDIGAHDLRHAFASLLLTRGAKLEQIQQVLGHSSYATTVIYASHLCPKRVSQDLNKLFT